MHCKIHSAYFPDDIYLECPLCKIDKDVEEWKKDPYIKHLLSKTERGHTK